MFFSLSKKGQINNFASMLCSIRQVKLMQLSNTIAKLVKTHQTDPTLKG
jgi:hypothetical protein